MASAPEVLLRPAKARKQEIDVRPADLAPGTGVPFA